MSVFEHLRPLVSLCQACGMIPFTIEENLTSNKFVRFTFSFRRRTTWWFMIIFLLQFVFVVITVKFSVSILDWLINDNNVPMTVTILSGITMFFYTAQLLLSRWIILNYRKLRSAVEALQKVEKLFGEKFIEEHQCFLGYRFIIAVTLIVTTIAFSFVVMASLFQQFFAADMGLLMTVALYFILSLISVTMECTFLLIHMSYYVISHYIKLLFLNSGKSDANGLAVASRKGAETIKELRQNALIFEYLCHASSELNDLFSVPVFFILTMKFVTVVSSAFTYIYSFTYTNLIFENSTFLPPFLFVSDWIRLLVIFTAADMPVIQVRLLQERLCVRSYSRLYKTLAENVAEMTILMQMNEDRIRMSAAGVFNVGVHLLPSLVGAVVTYMVILLQN